MTVRRVLITGGAGFIGSNVAHHFLTKGTHVRIVDDLSGAGSERNLAWLKGLFGGNALEFVHEDLSTPRQLEHLVRDRDLVCHFAGQTAVTRSLINPMLDFTSNLAGTIHLLEAIRNGNPAAMLIYSSTNKVYGDLRHLTTVERSNRYELCDHPLGIDESMPLSFRTPYGCSKTAADQYVIEYARLYNLRAVVFRQSCIFGKRQFGTEDHAWIVWLMRCCRSGTAIRIFGNGKQVRDVLHIDDLVAACEAAVNNIDNVAGKAYNIGGGPDRSISIWTEFSEFLRSFADRLPAVNFETPRTGDQLVYISHTASALRDMGWTPQVSLHDGLERTWRWVDELESR